MILLAAALLGLVLGSFVTMLSARLPAGGDLLGARSKCPQCHTALGVPDLVPVFSWLFLRGRCRHCAAPISRRYPVTELVMVMIAVLVAARLGATWEGLLVLLLGAVLLAMSVIDFEHGYLPDPLQVAAALLGGAFVILNGHWKSGLAGAAVGLAVGLALRYGYCALRKRHGLGLGDVKLFAVAGLWLGVESLVSFFAIAGVLGILFGLVWRRAGGHAEFPFGPALCATLFLLLLFPLQL